MKKRATKKPDKSRKNLIYEVMEEKGVTQYWLAKQTGITYITIHSYYHGKSEPSLDNLFKIAETLHLNPKELINS